MNILFECDITAFLPSKSQYLHHQIAEIPYEGRGRIKKYKNVLFYPIDPHCISNLSRNIPEVLSYSTLEVHTYIDFFLPLVS